MTPGARIQAAIEILEGFETSPLPLNRYFDRWSRIRRYAGAKDRAAIKDLVYVATRGRASYVWLTGGEDPRHLVIAALIVGQGLSLERLQVLFSGEGYGPLPLSDQEQWMCSDLHRPVPPEVQLNCPAWLVDEISLPPGANLHDELRASALRALIDLRVNLLKSTPNRAFQLLSEDEISLRRCSNSLVGLRIEATDTSQRPVNIKALEVYRQGLIEIQDEGSQIAALMVDAKEGHQVLDFCAGAGGKSLTLAAAMNNRGQIFAYDSDSSRLKRMAPRLKRAGVRNVQVRHEAADPHQSAAAMAEWYDKFDRVLVDAPCSGSGTWRRNPDAKWRLTPEKLSRHAELQARLLVATAPLVKPGGRLVYVTCSLLKRENEDRIEAFLRENQNFKLLPVNRVWPEIDALDPSSDLPKSCQNPQTTLALSPNSTKTDGTFIAVLEREG